MMEERRLFPRYHFERPVELQSPDGGRFDAQASELSEAGVGLYVSRAAVVSLARGGSILTPGDPVQLSIRDDRDTGGAALARVPCRVKHVRRLSQDRYVVSVWFADLASAQKSAIDRLLQQARSLRPS